MLESAVSLAMSGNVSGGVVADGKRGRRPDLSTVLVAQVNGFTGAVADRVVRSRCELVLAAIARPCITAALSGDLEAERGIGDDIHPRRGRLLIPVEDGDVLPSILIESANSVEEFERRRRDKLRRAHAPRRQTRRFGGRCYFLQTFDLLSEASTPAYNHHARHRLKQVSHLGRQQVGAQQEHRPMAALRHSRQVYANDRLQSGLQILDIRGASLVDDHQVHRELLHPPVGMRADQLAYGLQVFGLINPAQHHRQVARDTVRPKRRWAEIVPFQDFRRRSQRQVRVHYAIGETLEQVGFVRRYAEMMKLNLSLGPGQGGGTLERRDIVVLIGEAYNLVARTSQKRPKRQTHGRSRIAARRWPRLPIRPDGRPIPPVPPVPVFGGSPEVRPVRARTRSVQIALKTPDAPHHRSMAPRRPRNKTLPRSRACVPQDSRPTRV